MTTLSTRREILRRALAVAGLGALGLPEWTLPALEQGEALVPFTDLPAHLNLTPTADRRLIDIRRIDSPFTPTDQFYAIQHDGVPAVDPATFRLNVSGLVERPTSLSLNDLRRMRSSELVAGFECSGNRRPLQGLCSNGRWTGVPLRTVLGRVGVKAQAQEFVFFGADRGKEDVEFRGTTFEVGRQFGRSLSRDRALSPEPFLAYAVNGEPLSRHQGSPVRLIVPGWYGVANVKWLSEIRVQEERYVGRFQVNRYPTLRSETIDGEAKWAETAATYMRLKSFIARVTRTGTRHTVFGVVLNDGAPIEAVEVRVDDGLWRPAAMDPSTRSKYSWKLFTYSWHGATPGEHTIVSRVTDVHGRVQPVLKELASGKPVLEDNSQFPRTVMIRA